MIRALGLLCVLVAVAVAQTRPESAPARPRGPEEVPALIQELKAESGETRTAAAKALGNIAKLGMGEANEAMPALLEALKSASPATRAAIFWAIGQIGPETEDALVPLVAGCSDPNPDIRQDATWALARMGERLEGKAKAAVPVLIAALSDARLATRINATNALSAIGPAAKEAMPRLLELLDSSNAALVESASFAIWVIDSASDAAIPKLIRHLEGKEEALRLAAAWRLESYGPRARAALPGLVELLRADRSQEGVGTATRALLAIDREGTTAIPEIARLFHDSAPHNVDEIADGIKSYGRAASRFGPELAKMLAKSQDWGLRETVLNLGLEPAILVPALEARLIARVPDHNTYFPSTSFLRADPSGALALPALVRLTAHAKHSVRMDACCEIAGFGARAREAIPALRKLFDYAAVLEEDEAHAQRYMAVWTLAAIGPPAPFLPELIRRLRALPAERRGPMLAALAILDPAGKASVGFLAEQLAGNREITTAAAGAIERLGPAGVDAVPALVEALTGSSERAAEQSPVPEHGLVARLNGALGSIGPGASKAREALFRQLTEPQLSRALGAENAYPMRKARDALEMIGCPLGAPEVASLAATVRATPSTPESVLAAQRLGAAGAEAPAAVSALAAAVEGGPATLREAAGWAIGAIGPPAASAVPALMRAIETQAAEVLKDREKYLSASDDAVVETLVAALGRIGAAARPALPLLRRLPHYVGAEFAIRRIAPPVRKPLALEISPALPAPPPNFDPNTNFLTRAWKQPDGSFLVGIGDEGGFGGTTIFLFLSVDSQGKPVATADIEHFSDVSSGNRGPDPVESGLLTLRSAAWGSGAPIIGRFTMETEKGAPPIAFSFSVADPFAAAAARPR